MNFRVSQIRLTPNEEKHPNFPIKAQTAASKNRKQYSKVMRQTCQGSISRASVKESLMASHGRETMEGTFRPISQQGPNPKDISPFDSFHNGIAQQQKTENEPTEPKSKDKMLTIPDKKSGELT